MSLTQSDFEAGLTAYEFGEVMVGFMKGHRVRALKSTFEPGGENPTKVPISMAGGGPGHFTEIKNVDWDNPSLSGQEKFKGDEGQEVTLPYGMFATSAAKKDREKGYLMRGRLKPEGGDYFTFRIQGNLGKNDYDLEGVEVLLPTFAYGDHLVIDQVRRDGEGTVTQVRLSPVAQVELPTAVVASDGCNCSFPCAGCDGGVSCDHSTAVEEESISTESDHHDDGPCDGCPTSSDCDECISDGANQSVA